MVRVREGVRPFARGWEEVRNAGRQEARGRVRIAARPRCGRWRPLALLSDATQLHTIPSSRPVGRELVVRFFTADFEWQAGHHARSNPVNRFHVQYSPHKLNSFPHHAQSKVISTNVFSNKA